MTTSSNGRRLFLIAVGLMPVSALTPSSGIGQAFELSGGASTIYNAEGATLLVHGQHTETSIGGGFQDHHLVGGGATDRHFTKGDAILGLQTERTDVPTDLFNEGHLLVGTGAGVLFRGESVAHRELHAFAGFSSIDGGTPLFRSGSIGKPTAFGQWSREISDNCRAVTTGLYVQRVIGLESIECLPGGNPEVHLALTAGGGPSGVYGAASYALEDEQLHLHAAYVYQTQDFNRSTVTWGALPEPVRENISAEYKISRAWSVSGLRQNFVSAAYTDPNASDRDTPRQQTSLMQGGVQFHWRATSIGGGVLQSSLRTATTGTASILSGATGVQSTPALPTGATAGAIAAVPSGSNAIINSGNHAFSADFEQLIGRVRWTENLIRSYSSQMVPQTLLMSGVALRLNPHLLLTERVDSTHGTGTFAHGGELVTSVGSLHVDYELLYLANRPQQPFQQVTVVNASLHLWHFVAAELASAIEPTGKVGYTVKLTTFHSRSSATMQEANTQMGVNTIAGLVVDESGEPIPGAALLIGATHLYTDESGLFSLRERHATAHELRVLTDEFLSGGVYLVVSAPSTVSSAPQMATNPLRIVLTRRATAEVAAPTPVPESETSSLLPSLPASSRPVS